LGQPLFGPLEVALNRPPARATRTLLRDCGPSLPCQTATRRIAAALLLGLSASAVLAFFHLPVQCELYIYSTSLRGLCTVQFLEATVAQQRFGGPTPLATNVSQVSCGAARHRSLAFFRHDVRPEPTYDWPKGISGVRRFYWDAGVIKVHSTARTRSAKRAPRPEPGGVDLRRDSGNCAGCLVAR